MISPRSSAGGDDLLIKSLRRSGGRFLSGSRLARTLGLTRAAIHKRVKKLRGRGYRILGTNRLGYRLEASPDLLSAARFSGPLGRPFRHDAVLSSTQEEAKSRAQRGEPEGTLIAADRQTAGRGRMGRRWESPSGGLWYSLILRPALPPGQAPGLALVAALEWARVIRRKTGLLAQVKWPNDVWIGDRKAAGILTEMSSEIGRVHWLVLGVGVNVNNAAPAKLSVPAVSLAEAAGKPLSRQDLLAAWLKAFARSYRRYLRAGFPVFRRAYEKHSLLRGRRVRCVTSQGTVEGRAAGVDEGGNLLLRGPHGLLRLAEGEVTLKGGF